MSRTRTKIPEPLRAAYRAAKAARWTVTRATNGHLVWQPPGGGLPVQTSCTPRVCGHQVKNALARLRRAGLEC